MRRRGARYLQKASYGIYLFTLVYAPFAYGCTRLWTITGLEILCFASVIMWLGGAFCSLHLPRIHWVSVIPMVLALALGWGMALNATGLYDDEQAAFVSLDQNLVESLPGSIASNLSFGIVWPLTALLGGYLVACDMAADAVWRRRLFFTIALTGVALAVFGMTLKIGGPYLMSVFWEPDNITTANFALFRYHANAGAYLNMVWPLCLAFAWRAGEKLDGSVGAQLRCLGWISATLICWAALLINISKFAVLVFFLLLPIFLILRGRALFRRQLSQISWPVITVMLVLFVVIGLIIYQILASFATVGTSINRLDRLQKGEGMADVDQRLLSYSVELKMVNDAGWHGFGPGTFNAKFPEYAQAMSDRLDGYFFQAHQDYLQTWIEWGWLGCVFWSIPVLGGLARGWALYPRRDNFVRSEERLLWLGACLALTGVLIHALIDFPLQILALSVYVFTFLAIFWGTPVRTESAHSPRQND